MFNLKLGQILGHVPTIVDTSIPIDFLNSDQYIAYSMTFIRVEVLCMFDANLKNYQPVHVHTL